MEPAPPVPAAPVPVIAAGDAAHRRGATRRRRWFVPVAAIAAGVLVLAGGIGVGMRLVQRDDDRFATEYEEALRELGGQALAGARLVDASGRSVGRVFLYQGDTSWLFVELEPGRVEDLGVYLGDELLGHPTAAAWGTAVSDVSADDIGSVELRDDEGRVVATATGDSQSG
jgi:hypothetical protein